MPCAYADPTIWSSSSQKFPGRCWGRIPTVGEGIDRHSFQAHSAGQLTERNQVVLVAVHLPHEATP